MYKVLIYMATYNGEKFLKEQLDSLINQKEIEVDILIADDCSNDNTINILNDYKQRYSNLNFYVNEKNLGYRSNFMNLINKSVDKDYDFFALSDQDDVWKENKLIEGIKKLEFLNNETPLLYSSNLDVVDENLNFIKKMFNKKTYKENKYNMFLENTATGCTCIFNNKLRNLITKYPLDQSYEPHDEIIQKIALACGEYYFDSNSYILYRQHGNNQIGLNNKGKFKKYLSLLFGAKKMYHSLISKNIYLNYNKFFSEVKFGKFIDCIGNYKSSFSKYLILLLNIKYRKKGLIKNILFKISILTKKY